jgi:hypothetical protein
MRVTLATVVIFPLLGAAGIARAACSSDRDCGPGVSCRNGKCATAPGSSCGSDRDCGGASCRGGKCANAADGTCGSDRDCAAGTCRGGTCSSQGR